jgi:hypothetical protein
MRILVYNLKATNTSVMPVSAHIVAMIVGPYPPISSAMATAICSIFHIKSLRPSLAGAIATICSVPGPGSHDGTLRIVHQDRIRTRPRAVPIEKTNQKPNPGLLKAASYTQPQIGTPRFNSSEPFKTRKTKRRSDQPFRRLSNNGFLRPQPIGIQKRLFSIPSDDSWANRRRLSAVSYRGGWNGIWGWSMTGGSLPITPLSTATPFSIHPDDWVARGRHTTACKQGHPQPRIRPELLTIPDPAP